MWRLLRAELEYNRLIFPATFCSCVVCVPVIRFGTKWEYNRVSPFMAVRRTDAIFLRYRLRPVRSKGPDVRHAESNGPSHKSKGGCFRMLYGHESAPHSSRSDRHAHQHRRRRG